MSKSYLMGEVKAAADDDPNDPIGSFEVILSAPTLDRDGEVVDARAFDPLPDHITFDIDHGMTVATTVGSGTPEYLEDGRLKVVGTYSSIKRAQEVRTLVREGHIRTTSVAFMSAVRDQKDGVPHITSAELLNGAFVPIPSNRESVILTSKAYREVVGVDSAAGGARPLARPCPARKGWGMTANDLREAVSDAVRAAYDGPERWVWVRDYSDEWAVFIVEDESRSVLLQQNYAVSDRKATLVGDPTEVRMRTVYDPVGTESNQTAPVTTTLAATGSVVKSPARVRTARARALAASAALVAGPHGPSPITP